MAAGILGGVWMLKIGVNKALWLFGAVQAITVLGFVWLAGFGHFDTVGTGERLMLAAVIGAEAVGVGLGTAAFVSYMARETNPAFTATQLALFTSLSAVPHGHQFLCRLSDRMDGLCTVFPAVFHTCPAGYAAAAESCALERGKTQDAGR